ncbi:hypothetical protein HYY71_02990 [Candidatus Woesearchaeota archaeon]|nr:hypothetical protein [Candidatus Woesearchaeota archaeon]
MNRRILGGIAGLVFVLNTNFCNTQNTQPVVYQGWPVRHQGRNSAGDFIDHRIREGDYPMVRK